MKGSRLNPLCFVAILTLLVVSTKYTKAESASNENDSTENDQDAPYNQLDTNTDQDVEDDQTNIDPKEGNSLEDSSEESKETDNDIPQPPQSFQYPDNLEYSSYSSGPYINTDEIFESSYEEGYPENYVPFKNTPKESRYFIDLDKTRRIEDILCSILDLCDIFENTDSNEGEESYSSDREITIDAQPLDNNINIEDVNTPADNMEVKSRSKRSIDDNIENEHSHRAKRDLSFAFDDQDDDIVPLDELEFFAELINAEAGNEVPQQQDLADVLDSVEGLRRDQLSAGDILAEFELDEENGGLPFETNVDDNMMRKRGISRRDMTKFIQSLPTLEGMKKRSDPNFDEDEIDLSAYPRDLVVAAENELAAEELQNIETKAQVAAAMLDNAANLISVIENMAVDIVAEYLGIDDDDNEVPLEMNEFQQYLPSVPAKSIEKRIGRERYQYPSGIQHPFISEDLQQPFKGTYEPIQRQRYPGVAYGSYRRPSYGSRYRGISRAPVPPPFVDKHIGIFPNDNIFQPRYRRVQPNPYTAANSLPLFADDKYTDRNSQNLLSRIFSVNGNGVGRLKADGKPYLDGYFDDDEQNLRVEDGLQEAFDAALMMQNKIGRENLKNNDMGRGLEDAYVGNLLANIFRGRIGNGEKF